MLKRFGVLLLATLLLLCAATPAWAAETATATDTAKLLTCLGGEWTYVRTPVILIAEGKCIAASLYGEPHGGTDTISGNNMDGVVCLHLTNSRTHGSDRVDEDHQAAIREAYNWAHS